MKTNGCCNAVCKEMIDELLEVNRIWKNDYDNLKQENGRLKALLRMENTGNMDDGMIEFGKGLDRGSGDCLQQRSGEDFQKTIENIRILEEQLQHLKNKCEREREEKQREILKNENLKSKLAENEEVTFQLHQTIDVLQKKIKTEEITKTNIWGGCNCEQKRKARLMGRGAFPRNEHGFTGYKDERDSMTTEYQQSKNIMVTHGQFDPFFPIF
ncbi:uncharacterized protein [Clytia hemisphaerica]|uniref:Uncharacterized protein n=1 Tax=Clytia hemisphaerica TaxID=252671 RepID=A0A7M5WMI9_9CNID